MKAFLFAGYLEAVKGVWAAVKLFWPLLAIVAIFLTTTSILGNFRYTSNFKQNPLTGLALFGSFIAIVAYIFIILCQGAVGWHHRLLLNEKARWISPMPARRSLQYALPAFLFIFMMWVAMAPFTFVVLPNVADWLTASLRGIKLSENPTVDEFEALRWAVMPLQLFMMVCSSAIIAVVIWGGRSWLMAFPHVAVRAKEPVWGVIKNIIPLPAGLVGAVLVSMFLPSVVNMLYGGFVPISVQMLPWVATAASIVALVLPVLSLLAGLSILSIAYRQAQAGQIPYQETDHAAQN